MRKVRPVEQIGRDRLERFSPFCEPTTEGTLRWPDVDLPRSRDLLLLVEQHFLPLRQPTGHSRDGEQNGEEVGWKAHGSIDQSGVEVDIRIELSRCEVIV